MRRQRKRPAKADLSRSTKKKGRPERTGRPFSYGRSRQRLGRDDIGGRHRGQRDQGEQQRHHLAHRDSVPVGHFVPKVDLSIRQTHFNDEPVESIDEPNWLLRQGTATHALMTAISGINARKTGMTFFI